MDVSVLVPTYNEKDNIEPLIEEISSVLGEKEFEIIVIDDDSPDGTAQEVKKLQDDHSNLRLIEREGKQGLGSAYKEGFKEAEGAKIVQMDADFSHQPQYIPELLDKLEDGYDVVVGSRYIPGGDRNDPWYRRIFPLLGSYLYRHIVRSPVHDVTSGFKAYRSDVKGQMDDPMLPDGFHFQAASLLKLLEHGREITEIPIDFRPRREGEPKYTSKDLVDNLKLFLQLSFRRNKRLLKFGAVGTLGIGVNTGILYSLTDLFGLYYLLSAVIAIESSIIFNFILNDEWTFKESGRDGARHWMQRFSKFHLVSLAGMAVNLGVLWLLTDIFGVYYLVSNIIGIIVAFGGKYLGNLLWTWKH